jgi:hypothetical protein
MTTYQLRAIHASSSLTRGLSARIADPLWLVTRQWQLGELHGEDAASPVLVSWAVQSVPLDTLATGTGAVALSDKPLEVLVEREDPWTGPGGLRLSADMGLLLLGLLAERGLQADAERLRGAADLRLPVTPADPPVLQLLARRSLHAAALLTALTTTDPQQLAALAPITALVASLSPAAREALTRWTVLANSHCEGVDGGAWRGDRQEYAFQTATKLPGASNTPEAEAVLAAPAYPGGRLDWDSFEMTRGAPSLRGGRPDPKVTRTAAVVLPTAVRYRGMPASRWWEFEDGAVSFGRLEAHPEDIVRLVMAEFATTFGDDWMVVPVTLPVGALSRVNQLSVLDTFGVERLVEPIAAQDHKLDARRPWRLFELSGDPSASAGRCPWLLVPCVLTDCLEGPPVEEVLFVRDELANLGWAVERTLEGRDGKPRDRSRPAPGPTEDGPDLDWTFSLASRIPPGWIPLIPRPIARKKSGKAVGTDIELRRGRLAGWGPDEGPQARLLEPTKALAFKEEALPIGGMLVTRTWQRARGADGRVHLWLGRRKRPGLGEQSSGLEFDRLKPGH